MKKLFNLLLAISIMIVSVNPCYVNAELTELSGTWTAQTGASADYIESQDNIVTLNIPNNGDDGKGSGKVKWKAENRSEIDYVLDSAIDGGNIVVSYEFKTNSSLQAAARAAEIRFTDSENNASSYALSVVNSVTQPYIYQGPATISKFTDSELSADEWHEAQYVFYVDDNGLETKQVIIDNQDVNGVFSYKKNANVTSLKAIEFWFFGNSANIDDYELNIRNMSVKNGVEEIEITSDIDNNAENITKNNFKLSFSHAVTSTSRDAISLIDENGNQVLAEKYSVELAPDGKSAEINIKANESDSNKTYKIKVSAEKFKGQKSEILADDYILSFTFGTIEPTPSIIVTSDIADNSVDVIPANMRFVLSVDKDGYKLKADSSSFNKDMIRLYDENGDEDTAASLKAELDDKNNVIFVTINNYTGGKKYMLKILGGAVEGIGGEQINADYILKFTASRKNNISGTWKKTFSKHESEINLSGADINIKVKNDGTNGQQTTRDSYTYAFDNVITGTNVPVKVKYKFKANKALSQSESEVRFYPYQSGEKGGACICLDFPYSTPRFRWDSIRFNLPSGVSSLAPDEWHEAEYLFIVDSTNGFSIINAVIDGVITDTSYKKASTKQMGCVDFWFYSTANNTDDLEIDIKDFSVVSGADIIDFESEINDGAVGIEPKDMKITFSESIYYDCDIKEVISVVDSDNNTILSEKYSVVMSDNNTVAHITMNTDDRDSEKTYKIFVDKSKIRGKYYSVLAEDLYISFTLPKIDPKATLGIKSELPDGSKGITPADLKFNIVPLPNDRISDVSEYVISADESTDLNSVISICDKDGNIEKDIISNARMSDDRKSFTVTLSNYERYTEYKIKIPKGSIVGYNGEIMQNDFSFAFETSEIDKPPYAEHELRREISWHGNISVSEENGITTFNYKNSTAKGDSNARSEICYYLDEAITNSGGPIEISYSFQINDALANTTGGESLMNILCDKSRGGFLFHLHGGQGASLTDYKNGYMKFYNNDGLKIGAGDNDEWNTITYIFDVDNGVVKSGYAKLNNNSPIDITSLSGANKNNFGEFEFRLYSRPNTSGVYEDYVFKIKDISVKSLGALKGEVSTEDNKNLSLRFSYNVPFLFESDIIISELKNGKYQEIKQSYSVEDMNADDMKQVNIIVGDGGLAYNKDYRLTINRKGITADDYVKLKITDIDFKTKEYPDNLKADVEFLTSDENISKVNCSISNLQSETQSAYIIVAAYNGGGEMIDKYCENINSIEGGGTYKIKDISLSGNVENIKVFIFRDDIKFKIYHMPQSFKK